MLNDKPNPGSPEAMKKGCLCAVIDNHYGNGYMGIKDMFVINGDCPIHGGGKDAVPV